MLSVIGDRFFRESILEEQAEQEKQQTPVIVHGRPEVLRIMKCISKHYKIPLAHIQTPQIGTRSQNLPRKYAMYLAQQVGYQLSEIAQAFGVQHRGSVSNALTDVRKRILHDLKLKNSLSELKESLWR